MDREHELISRVERNRAWRDADLKKTQSYRDRMNAIREAKRVDRLAFWCDNCHKDFISIAYKQVRQPKGQLPIAWHVGKCPCGYKALRYITDKGADPYYYKSFYMKLERVKLSNDLVQPGDPRFRILYPAQYRKMQEDREQQELWQSQNL